MLFTVFIDTSKARNDPIRTMRRIQILRAPTKRSLINVCSNRYAGSAVCPTRIYRLASKEVQTILVQSSAGRCKKLWVVPNANGKEFGALADPQIEVARMGVQAPEKREISGGQRGGGEARPPQVRENLCEKLCAKLRGFLLLLFCDFL